MAFVGKINQEESVRYHPKKEASSKMRRRTRGSFAAISTSALRGFSFIAVFGAVLCSCALCGCSGPTSVMEAAEYHDTSALDQFLSPGSNVNLDARDYQGYTALHWAAYYGYLDIAQALVEHGASLEVLDDGKLTPLEVAVCYQHPDVVRFLVSKGANVNARDASGWSALEYATSNSDYDIAKLLIENGADVNSADNDGHTVLQTAYFYKTRSIARLLQKHGARE